ncbi:MAG: outer membrane lipoprotein-sorting protein [Elusimicrobiota bacterium]
MRFLLLLGLLVSGSSAGEPRIDAEALVRRVETAHRGKTSRAVARMRIVTEFWKRELTMEMWGEGRERFLAVVRSPKKERGTATLKRDDEVWNYLPKIDRLIKVPSSLMGDSWMGSHITNDDLVKEDKIEELFDLTVESVEGSTVTILCVPKPDAAVVWGKIVYHVDQERLIALDVDYYDEDGEKVRTLAFDKVEKIAGRWIPLRIKILPVDNPDERTEIVYDELELDIPLKKGLFSLRGLRRKR